MSAYDYCRDKVALPGSSLYYSLLFVPSALRTSLTALHAAAEEFREVVDECSDESIARAKLGWWAEEMQRACAGQARHPVAQALAVALHQSDVDAERFDRVLLASSEHLRRDAYATLAELESHYECVADITGCMAAQFCGYQDPVTVQLSRELGAGLALASLISHPQQKGGRRDTDLPREILTECGATSADLSASHTAPALKKTLAIVAKRARTRLQAFLQQMPEADRDAQRSRRALAEMAMAQLDAIERADFAVLEEPRAVTPLRKLWIAWKHRRP
jgi:phytoene synthase